MNILLICSFYISFAFSLTQNGKLISFSKRNFFVSDLNTVLFPDISERTPPKFPSSYIAKAIMFIPYSEIMEPFQAWYDENTKSSRVDYYGGNLCNITSVFLFLNLKL